MSPSPRPGALADALDTVFRAQLRESLTTNYAWALAGNVAMDRRIPNQSHRDMAAAWVNDMTGPEIEAAWSDSL